METDEVEAELNDENPVIMIKQENVSEDENADFGTSRNTETDETNRMYSNDDSCFFLQECVPDLHFKEEEQDEEFDRSLPLDELLDVKVESIKTELTSDEIVMEEDPAISSIYLDENTDVPNVKIIKRKTYRKPTKTRRHSLYASLFSYPPKDNRDSILEDSVLDVDDNRSGLADDSPKKRYACSICRRYYQTQAALEAHKNEQKCDQRFFECALCSRKFPSKKKLSIHILRLHNIDAKFRCEICFKSFLKESALITHRKQHFQKFLYKCDKCAKTFLDKNYLYIHKKIHSEERPFVCEVCNMSFKYKGVLKTHLLVHQDDDCIIQSVFNCTFCSKSFPRNGQLKKHMRAHAYQQYKFALYQPTS